jgi:hypothetical protein
LPRFRAIVDAYGATPERWPEAERAAALNLARSSIVAARALAEARRVDMVLRLDADREIPAARLARLQAGIVARAVPQAKNWMVRWLGFDIAPAQLWPSVAGLALASALGFVVGVGGLLQSEAARDVEYASGYPTVDSAFGVQ